MKIDKNSLLFRILIPILLTIAVIAVGMALIGGRVIHEIVDDYHHYMADNQARETRRLFDAALAEMTSARLLDNPAVVAVKKEVLVEAIGLDWQRRGVGGIIVGEDGAILLTTLSPALTSSLISRFDQGFIDIHENGGVFFGQVDQFHPWGWQVISISEVNDHELADKNITKLIPLLILGPLLMLGGLLIVLRQFRRPMNKLVSALSQEEAVVLTGVTEFDTIGDAYNRSLGRIRERTFALAEQLAERKLAEELIRRKEERISLLLQSASEGIYGVDTVGNCTFCNPACCRLLGYTEEQLLGNNIHNLVHYAYADGNPYHEEDCRAYEAFRNYQQTHENGEVFWRADGSSFPVEYWSHPVLENGIIVGAVVTFFDITTRKQMEEALRAEKNKIEAIIAGLGDGISIQDLNYTVIYQNEVHQGFVGSHIGETCFKAYEQRDEVCQGCPVALSLTDGLVHTAERSLEGPGGARYFEITSSPLRDGSGNIIGGIELVRDVTERKRSEEQLLHAQKMEGIGHLAGGVAHDFNNVLNVIQGYSDLLSLSLPEDKTLNSYLTHILEAVQRGATITRQILSFSRKGAMTIEPVKLNELIAVLQKMLRRLVREDIEIEVHFSEESLVIDADPGQVDQVLINLVTNASDAMPDGGKLRIETGVVTLDEEFIKLHGYGTPGEYALITVSDTGTGMPEAVRLRIFEPFFTTKKIGKGTGLGLAMIYGIVRKHNGYINVYSELGHGTVFRIYLPRTSAAPVGNAIQELELAEVSLDGTETILVAEDDLNLREWARTMLEMRGYKVILAEDGSDAVKKFAALQDSIDLVMLDGVMPNQNGREALVEMRALRPELKAIILSGYAEEVFSPEDLKNLKVTFVAKPVVPNQLLRTIRQVLAKE